MDLTYATMQVLGLENLYFEHLVLKMSRKFHGIFCMRITAVDPLGSKTVQKTSHARTCPSFNDRLALLFLAGVTLEVYSIRKAKKST